MKNSTETTEICCTPFSISQKLKILVIHGYRQNADVFRAKTGSFRKMVHKWAQFNYVTAPHKVLLVDDIDVLENPEIGQSKDEGKFQIYSKKQYIILSFLISRTIRLVFQ